MAVAGLIVLDIFGILAHFNVVPFVVWRVLEGHVGCKQYPIRPSHSGQVAGAFVRLGPNTQNRSNMVSSRRRKASLGVTPSRSAKAHSRSCWAWRRRRFK